MRYKLLAALVIICSSIQAQQINPVPDYVFANRMSVGRTAVTDTLAYFSIGPRYGAIRGFMPPMVVDTALVTGGTKRNGLTIFSIQKNKYLYWDSVRVQWSDFAGSSGAYIFATDTSSMLSPYIRAAGNGLTKSGQSLLVDTASIATRARVQKAVDSINANVALKVNISDTATMLDPYTRGSGTTNYMPKFTGSRTFGNSQIFDNGTIVGINTTTNDGYLFNVNGISRFGQYIVIQNTIDAPAQGRFLITSNYGTNSNGNNVFVGGGGQSSIGVSGETYRGSLNVSLGKNALLQITTGFENSAFGANSLYSVTTGYENTAFGVSNSYYLTSGIRNTSLGHGALFLTNSSGNVTTNSNSIMIGYDARPSANGNTNEIVIAYQGRGNGSNTTTIGNTSTGYTYIPAGELLIGTTTDAGAYALQVAGSIYNTTGAVLAASSGNVGIGTTSPSQKLDINFTDNQTYSAVTDNANALDLFNLTTTDNTFSAIRLGSQGSGSAGVVTLYGVQTPDASGTAFFAIATKNSGTHAERMRVTAAGNVGIGTNSPSTLLDVRGELSIAYNASYGIRFYNQDRSNWSSIGNNIATGSTSANLRFTDATGEVMRLTGGEVLIGTTTDAGAYALQVAGSIYNTTGAVFAASSGNVGIGSTPINYSGYKSITIAGGSNGSVLDLIATGGETQGGFQIASQVASKNTNIDSYGQLGGARSSINIRTGVYGTVVSRIFIDTAGLVGINTASPTERLHVVGNILTSATITTGAPTSGSAKPWRLGEAATVSPTSPNRTIRVEIDGTVYYIHAKTTND